MVEAAIGPVRLWMSGVARVSGLNVSETGRQVDALCSGLSAFLSVQRSVVGPEFAYIVVGVVNPYIWRVGFALSGSFSSSSGHSSENCHQGHRSSAQLGLHRTTDTVERVRGH